MRNRILQAIVTMGMLTLLAVGAKVGEAAYIKEVRPLDSLSFDEKGFVKEEFIEECEVSGILKTNDGVIKDVKEIGMTRSHELFVLKKDGKLYQLYIR